MTREEAIKELETIKMCEIDTVRQVQALDVALASLRGPTREMVERMRGEWIDIKGEKVVVDEYGCPVGWAQCSACGKYLIASDEYSCTGHFCPACGAPMTDEAVQMVM